MGTKIESIKLFENSISNVKKGDLSELKMLYIEERRGIFLFILSIVKDYGVAEDILHDVFIKIIINSEKYKRNTNAKAWIMTIARNLSLNYLNKNKHINFKENIEVVANNKLQEIESEIEFLRMIEPLSEIEKQIIILRLNVGFSYIQIAKILDISIVNARAKYSRGIKKLRLNEKDRI